VTPLEILSRQFLELDIVRTGGVYLLIRRDEIVYVGSSCNVTTRVASHIHKGMKFDRVLWFPLPRKRAMAAEGAITRWLSPRLNYHTSTYTGNDSAILVGLGLPANPNEEADARKWTAHRGDPARRANLRNARLKRAAARKAIIQ
jgi:hypothetical protein